MMYVPDDQTGGVSIETYFDPYAHLSISMNYEKFTNEHGSSNNLLSFDYQEQQRQIEEVEIRRNI